MGLTILFDQVCGCTTWNIDLLSTTPSIKKLVIAATWRIDWQKIEILWLANQNFICIWTMRDSVISWIDFHPSTYTLHYHWKNDTELYKKNINNNNQNILGMPWLASKSLYRSRAESHFYGTENVIWAGYGPIGNNEKMFGPITSDFWE